MNSSRWILTLCLLGVSAQVQANSWGKNNFSTLKENASAVFSSVPERVYGIGLSSQNGASFNQYINSGEEFED